MCILNSVKETFFSQKYQKWIYQVLEINSSFDNLSPPDQKVDYASALLQLLNDV